MSDLISTYVHVAQRPLDDPIQWAVTTIDGKPLDHLSPSGIAMFRRCLEQGRRRYVLGQKERPGGAAIIGSTVHAGLEWNYRQKIDSHEDVPLPEAVEYLNDLAIHEVIEERGGPDEIEWDQGTGPEEARLDAERVFSAYYRSVVPRVQPVAVEQRIRIRPVQLPIELMGYIDTETESRIIDVKTGKRAVTSLKPSWQLQADVYSTIVGKPVEFHTASRAKAPTITTPVERGDDLVVYPSNVDRLMNSLGQMARLIEWCYLTYGPDNPWPTTGRIGDFTQNKLACDFCGWRKDCVAWKD